MLMRSAAGEDASQQAQVLPLEKGLGVEGFCTVWSCVRRAEMWPREVLRTLVEIIARLWRADALNALEVARLKTRKRGGKE